jgi:hypothetical protein
VPVHQQSLLAIRPLKVQDRLVQFRRCESGNRRWPNSLHSAFARRDSVEKIHHDRLIVHAIAALPPVDHSNGARYIDHSGITPSPVGRRMFSYQRSLTSYPTVTFGLPPSPAWGKLQLA